MFEFDGIDLNPNKVDLQNYNCDKRAMETTQYMAERFQMKPQQGYPEGFDIEVSEIRDVKIPDTGYPFSNVKIYYPSGEGPFPVLFYIHGGSFYGGWQFLDAPLCRQVCVETGIAVVSPSYVLAPDFPFPLPLIEMYKELLYLRDNQDELNLDMSRVAVGGGSAGGHHALGLCQIAHERYDIEHIKFDYGVFYYPFMDGMAHGEDRDDKLIDNDSVPLSLVDTTLDMYCPKEMDRSHPLFSPINMDLEALPPSIMFSGRKDPLQWDFKRFVSRVLDEGKNEMIFKTYPQASHGFLESDVCVEAGRDSKRMVCDILKSVFYK